MSDDNFYGLYGERILVVHGTVASVAQQSGDTIIELKTDAIFKAYCDIGHDNTNAQAGNDISVLAVGFNAERLTTSVQLMGCVEL